jgi:hypothetical protein
MRSSRTALTAFHPGRDTIVAFFIFFPHHDANTTCGSRRTTSAGSTIRSFARPACVSSGKIGRRRQSRPAPPPSDARDQRIVPFLEEHAQPHRQARRRLADAVQIRGEAIGQLLGLALTADQAAEHRDHLKDLGHRALVEDDDVEAAAHELGDQVGLQIRERQHEIGLERLDLVELRVDEGRDLRRAALPAAHRIARDADDAIALPEQIERLGRFSVRQTMRVGYLISVSGYLVI